MKHFKLITVLALLFVTRSAAIAQPAGTGSFEDPYRITSINDLVWFSNNSSLWGDWKYLVQINDIDASVVPNFTPIGNASYPAKLFYDGQNFKINKLTINQDYPLVGLFGYLHDGSVKNLTLNEVAVESTTLESNTYVGALAGRTAASIFNCHVTNSTVKSQGDHVGGLVGSSSGTIEQCYVWTYTNGRNYVGGVAGSLYGGTILASYVAGKFTASVNYAGGIVGAMADGATVSNCYSKGNYIKAANYAGGIAGRLLSGTATIVHSWAYNEDVSATSGSNVGEISSDAGITQTYCYYYRVPYIARNLGTGSTLTTITNLATPSFLINAGWDYLCETANGTRDYWKNSKWTLVPTVNDMPAFAWTGDPYSSNCKEWNGHLNSDWTYSLNWTPSGVPSDGSAIYIPADVSNNPELPYDVSLSNVIFGNQNGTTRVILGDYNLTVDKVTNARGENFIRTGGAGRLIKTLADGETFTFPVGHSGFAPVTITNNTGAADVFKVGTFVGVYDEGTTGNLLDVANVNGVYRTWLIDKNNPNNTEGVDITFNWLGADLKGTVNNLVLLHYNPASQRILPTKWDKYQNVSVVGNSLTIMGYKDGLSTFAIMSNNLMAMPVTWGAFTASKQQQHALLKWTTLGEYNSKNYFVQHSVDGRSWKTIGSVAAAGNTSLTSNYQFVHENPVIGKNYYRLLQMDIDGRQSIRKTVVLQWTAANVFQVYPNPARSGSVQVNSGKAGTLQFYNASGAMVKQVQVNAGNNTIDISSLAKGYYILVAGEEKASLIIK